MKELMLKVSIYNMFIAINPKGVWITANMVII